MNVLQLSKYYPPTLGGLEIVADFFSRAFQDLGHKVTVISLGTENRTYTGAHGESVLQSKEDVKLNSSPLSLAYYRNAVESIKSLRPAYVLVHLPNPFAHEIVKRLSPVLREHGGKFVGIYHSDIINQVLLRDAYNLHFSRHFDAYDFFVCSSPDLKKSSALLSQLPDSKVKIIPFCIDHSFPAGNRQRPFSGKFISIGRMVPYKGYEFLIKTFNDLPYRLTLVGGGPLKESLKQIAAPNVIFAGQLSEQEKYQLMNEQDALIMSSINRAEAYGMTIVEAFSIGLPVIAANVDTGVSYLVRDGETGLKFPILDAQGLKDRVDLLKGQSGLAEKLSKGSKELFEKELSWTAFRSKVKSAFEAQ